ncbi:MAG: translation initiation factor IF-2 [Fimbriimonadaceae bacterium]|nr:translation initiation factor IF-2 [Fimbriimonadaceae bacterium]
MTVTIAELATEFGLKPGQIYGALHDLGLEHDAQGFETDEESLELIRESLAEMPKDAPLVLQPNVTPRDIAAALDLAQPEVQKTLMMKMKVMATLTTVLKADVAEKFVQSFGHTIRWADAAKPKSAPAQQKTRRSTKGAQPRPPVVTIMGHVDHGKTSLLDFIRKANVVSREHGGITQHIGAYQVQLPEGKITFLDTPGHAAFTAMRARGAQVTDIAILVVAADDGIMPQTKEAISHILNAEVPMIVAVNKIDRPDANPDRVIQQLPEHEVIPEVFGGQTIVCPVSAITGEGVPHLLEMVLLQAEVLGLQADPKGPLEGVVIEAKLEKGRGPVATLLIQEGTLKVGDTLVVGSTWGRIKAMHDYTGERIEEAGPSTPVEVLGLNETPLAGDTIERESDEREARERAEGRAEADRVSNLATPERKITLRDLRSQMDSGELRELLLVVKADVSGSVEAVRGMLEKISNAEVETRIIHSGVGSITEGDVLLAGAAGAICVGFNVKPEPGAKKEAEKQKVEIRTYTIIYELIEDIEAAVKGMLEPKFEEQYLGKAEIRVRFKLTKKGIVAGSHVTDGKVTRNCKVRVRRGEELVYEGKLSTLKHLKDDVREVTEGFDCGLTFDNWEAFQEGDVVEAFEMIQVNA